MKNKGIKAERVIEKRTLGKTTPASGAAHIKGDVLADIDAGLFGKFNIQSKYTDKPSFTLKLKDLLSAQSDAAHEGREMLFVVSFGSQRFWIVADYLISDIVKGK